MTISNNLSITHIEQNQSQKEVTINEAINRIDAILNVGAIDQDLATPPVSPSEGDLYIVASSPTGDWSGQDGNIAYYNAGWKFIIPKEGITIWVNDEDLHYTYDGSNWTVATSDNFQSDLVTFDTETGDVQLKINKDNNTDTASLLFQTGFSTRGEFGLIGENDFELKVSPDGTNYYQSYVVDKDTGDVDFKQDISVVGVLKHSEIRDYSETVAMNATATGAVTIDYDNGNIHQLTLTGDISGLTISNPPGSGKAGNLSLLLIQDATGGRTISWPASVQWVGGNAPTLSSSANAVDMVNLVTTDGGTHYYATALLDFS